MRRIYSFLLLFLPLVPVVATAQQPALQSITTADLRKHLTIIASDSMAGRGLSTEVEGLEYAADYLKQQAEKTGLQPGGKGYTQEFSIIKSTPRNNTTSLSVIKNGEETYRTDSLISLTRGISNQNIEGQPVFAGFGRPDAKPGSTSINVVDVNEKIAVISVGKPDANEKDGQARWNTEQESQKVEKAFENGALAVVLVTGINDTTHYTYNRLKRWMNRPTYTIASGSAFEKIPVVVVTPHIASAILGDNYREWLNSLNEQKEATNLSVQNQTIIRLDVEKELEMLPVENIIGIVEGSHPELKNECVVVMAHYDHLGTNERGEIYNGADDNGSGTVALLEIAEAFMHLDKKPDRSIVFAWVTAEEVGLLGSEYYVQHPVFPLNKTVACINLDMVGRVYEPRDSVHRKSPKQVKEFDGIYTLISDFSPKLENITDSITANLGLEPDKTLPGYFFRSSDHHHFHSRGVPILNLATGYHADYHKISDEVSKINFKKLKRVTDLTFLVTLELANQKSKIKRE